MNAMFAYDDSVAERYPMIRAGVVHATGLDNGPSSTELLDEYRAEQRAASERLKATAIADLPSIAARRRAFTRFGAKPTQYRSAAEALLRRLAKHGDIPTISTLVDIGNLVSIRYAMPVAVFDPANIAGSTTVRFATGDELFIDLGSTDRVSPNPGEVIFADDDDMVSARRWCWRLSSPDRMPPQSVDLRTAFWSRPNRRTRIATMPSVGSKSRPGGILAADEPPMTGHLRTRTNSGVSSGFRLADRPGDRDGRRSEVSILGGTSTGRPRFRACARASRRPDGGP